MSEDIEVKIQCDYLISKEVYLKVLEGLLKYILYQCNQIPVQIDVLQRDNQTWKSHSHSESVCNKKSKDDENVTSSSSYYMNAREEIKERLQQRKKEHLIRNYEKKRRTWLLKVDNFLNCYKSVITMLQEEFDKSNVSSVIFIIGNSPSLANVVFKIYINSRMPTPIFQCHGKKRNSSSCFADKYHDEPLEKKIFLALFRAFAANDELTKFISGHFATTKVWLLLHKQPSSSSDINDRKLASKINCDLIPQIDFKIPRRAKVINIVLNELPTFCNNEIVDMELTPCIDSKVIHFSNASSVQINNFGDRKRIKISLFPSVYNAFDTSSSSNTSCDKLCFNKCNDMPKPKFEAMSEIEKRVIQDNTNKCNDSVSMCLLEDSNLNGIHKALCQNSYLDDIDEIPMSPVEISPKHIKLLSKNVDSLHFDKEYSQIENFIWYQYPICIQGFKDLYLHNNFL